VGFAPIHGVALRHKNTIPFIVHNNNNNNNHGHGHEGLGVFPVP
jgi:hypothetical protein